MRRTEGASRRRLSSGSSRARAKAAAESLARTRELLQAGEAAVQSRRRESLYKSRSASGSARPPRPSRPSSRATHDAKGRPLRRTMRSRAKAAKGAAVSDAAAPSQKPRTRPSRHDHTSNSGGGNATATTVLVPIFWRRGARKGVTAYCTLAHVTDAEEVRCRLERTVGQPGQFRGTEYETVARLQPGEHCLRFRVDGKWVLDPELPTIKRAGTQFNLLLAEHLASSAGVSRTRGGSSNSSRASRKDRKREARTSRAPLSPLSPPSPFRANTNSRKPKPKPTTVVTADTSSSSSSSSSVAPPALASESTPPRSSGRGKLASAAYRRSRIPVSPNSPMPIRASSYTSAAATAGQAPLPVAAATEMPPSPSTAMSSPTTSSQTPVVDRADSVASSVAASPVSSVSKYHGMPAHFTSVTPSHDPSRPFVSAITGLPSARQPSPAIDEEQVVSTAAMKLSFMRGVEDDDGTAVGMELSTPPPARRRAAPAEASSMPVGDKAESGSGTSHKDTIAHDGGISSTEAGSFAVPRPKAPASRRPRHGGQSPSLKPSLPSTLSPKANADAVDADAPVSSPVGVDLTQAERGVMLADIIPSNANSPGSRSLHSSPAPRDATDLTAAVRRRERAWREAWQLQALRAKLAREKETLRIRKEFESERKRWRQVIGRHAREAAAMAKALRQHGVNVPELLPVPSSVSLSPTPAASPSPSASFSSPSAGLVSRLRAETSELAAGKRRAEEQLQTLREEAAALRRASDEAREQSRVSVRQLKHKLQAQQQREQQLQQERHRQQERMQDLEQRRAQQQQDQHREQLEREKQRVHVVESKLATLQEQLQAAYEQLDGKDGEVQGMLAETKAAAKADVDAALAKVDALRVQSEQQSGVIAKQSAQLSKQHNAIARHDATAAELRAKMDEAAHDTRALRAALNRERESRGQALRQNAKSLASRTQALQQGVRQLKQDHAASVVQMQVQMRSVQRSLASAALLQNTKLQEVTRKYRRELRARRKYFNLVQELRGNIRVFCRCRPLLPSDRKQGAKLATRKGQGDDNDHTIVVSHKGKKHAFEFDRVLGADSTQESVFEDTAPLIQSVMDGYNVCVFAYGQTGSGKTHTMQGGEAEHERGVNYRALKELFRVVKEREGDYTYTITVSMSEIYNETLRDLLWDHGGGSSNSNNSNGSGGGGGANSSNGNNTGAGNDDVVRKPPELRIRKSKSRGTFIEGLQEWPVKCEEDVLRAMQLGAKNRSTAHTRMNADSSRSHSLVSVRVKGVNKALGLTLRGKLHLIDLAGSERVKQSGAKGQRMREARAINKSLSALGNVVEALQRKSPHVPYRDSKLTFVLEDSLGGHAKCLMFINVSPTDIDAEETACSLMFATRVRRVELGPSVRNSSHHSSNKNGNKSNKSDHTPPSRQRGAATPPPLPESAYDTPRNRPGSRNSNGTSAPQPV